MVRNGGSASEIRGTDAVRDFQCPSHPDLEKFLREHAISNHEKGFTRTFVLRGTLEGRPAVLGYHSLCALHFDKGKSGGRWSDGPRSLPAALIARLAVDHRCRGKGLGAALLVDALERVGDAANSVAMCAVIVDAIDDHAAAFYTKYGFERLPVQSKGAKETRLFLPIAAISDLVRPGSPWERVQRWFRCPPAPR